MKSCWNCNKANLEDSDAKCWACGAAVAVIQTAPEPPPAPREAAPPPRRREYVLKDQPQMTDTAREAVGYRVEQATTAARTITRLFDAIAANRHAAVFLVCVVGLIVYASSQPATAPLPLQHWRTALEAEKHQMWLRVVKPSAKEIGWRGRAIRILDAWAAHVGQHRYRSMFASDTEITFSGRQAVYFTTPLDSWPEVPQFYVGNPLRPVENLRNDKEVLHWIEVDYGTAPKITVHVQDAARPEDGRVTFTLQ